MYLWQLWNLNLYNSIAVLHSHAMIDESVHEERRSSYLGRLAYQIAHALHQISSVLAFLPH